MRAGYPVRTFDQSTRNQQNAQENKGTYTRVPSAVFLTADFHGMSYPASLRTCGRYEFLSEHLLYDKMLSNIAELSARDATICVVGSRECESADDMIIIPEAKSYMEEFFSMMLGLQLLSLEVAIRLGNDVDMPRNLAKSVTVE